MANDQLPPPPPIGTDTNGDVYQAWLNLSQQQGQNSDTQSFAPVEANYVLTSPTASLPAAQSLNTLNPGYAYINQGGVISTVLPIPSTDLATTGVTAGTYGGAAQRISLTVNAQGQITNVSANIPDNQVFGSQVVIPATFTDASGNPVVTFAAANNTSGFISSYLNIQSFGFDSVILTGTPTVGGQTSLFVGGSGGGGTWLFDGGASAPASLGWLTSDSTKSVQLRVSDSIASSSILYFPTQAPAYGQVMVVDPIALPSPSRQLAYRTVAGIDTYAYSFAGGL